MKAYELGDYARTGRLRLVERPNPTPGPGEALVRIRATGPNARDFSIMRRGAEIHIPFCDMAGDVVSVGEGVTAVAPGDRVTMPHYWQWLDGEWNESMRHQDFGFNLDGFLRELAAVPEAALIKLPDSVSYEAAATLPSAGLTAWQAVVATGRTKLGETLVTIGTGGVSVFATQWGKLMGARVIATSSSDEKLARMKALGADDGINYRRHPEWAKEVMALTDGRGADIVINNVGVPELDQCLEACASNGRVMYIGANSVAPDRADAAPVTPKRLPLLIIRDLTLKGIIVGSRAMFVDMLDAMDRHDIRPVIDRTFDFDQANEAVAYAAAGEKLGKVSIRV